MKIQAQIRQLNAAALDPDQSVVIEACAGSGKTWLLVSRIIRLLLADVRPSEILAITFTRKAAQEMQARLHEWLRFLATGTDDEVMQFLYEREIAPEQIEAVLPRARGLFEAFLADYPGITISTFHGWFLQLLKRAPLAAGAANAATLVDQTSSLIDEAWESFAQGLQREPDSKAAQSLDWLFGQYGLNSTQTLLTAFVHKRLEWWSFTQSVSDPVAFALEKLAGEMQVAPDADVVGGLFADQQLESDLVEYADLLERNETKTDIQAAARLRTALEQADPAARFASLWPVFMTTSNSLRARKENNAVRRRLGEQGQRRLLEIHARVGEALTRVNDLLVEQMAYRVNEAGLLCGTMLLDRYQSIKRFRGAIDYADVEWQTWSLLTTGDHAEYLQYRLDARYRHILLDEFQDTNPLQWQVLRAWLDASADAGTEPRVFMVGDPKQSIYRFRRAEPRLFDVARRYLAERHRARALVQNVTRRNAPAVTEVVNAAFTDAMDGFLAHRAYQQALPGRVELLPLFEHTDDSAEQTTAWRNPLDSPRIDDQDRRRLQEADVLAQRIGEMVGRLQVVDGAQTRPLRYGDVQILVRRRTHLDIYERALRHAQIPFIGSRQGGLLDTLEASDMTALLQFLVLPFADIQLATVLRSPIFGLADQDLLDLREAAGSSMWQRLCERVRDGQAGSTMSRAHRLLGAWMQDADARPVHDLLDRIYFEADVMRRYQAAVPRPMRAGVLANLRAFMEVALSTDSGRYPSLQGFLHRLENMRRAAAEESPDTGVIAEDVDAVRILTVHGAKGLEAPVVWLLDTNAGRGRTDSFDVLVDWPPDAARPRHFSLFTRKNERGESRAQLFEQDERLAEREDINLLYVAMTRARQVLVASGSAATERAASWYQRIAAVIGEQTAEASMPEAESVGDVSVPCDPLSATGSEDWATLQSPMNIGMRTDDLVDPQRRRGTQVHALLERIAPPAQPAGRDFLRNALRVSVEEFESIWRSARGIVDEPSLSRFFDPGQYLRAVNEMSYATSAGELRRIDRVVEFENEIWVLDYKTGESADKDSATAAYRQQLEEYRAAVMALMPGKAVRSALILAGGHLLEI